MQLTTILALAFTTLAAAVPTAPVERGDDRGDDRLVGWTYDKASGKKKANLRANVGCHEAKMGNSMRLHKGWKCKFYYKYDKYVQRSARARWSAEITRRVWEETDT
jgi:hypothetical protein